MLKSNCKLFCPTSSWLFPFAVSVSTCQTNKSRNHSTCTSTELSHTASYWSLNCCCVYNILYMTYEPVFIISPIPFEIFFMHFKQHLHFKMLLISPAFNQTFSFPDSAGLYVQCFVTNSLLNTVNLYTSSLLLAK